MMKRTCNGVIEVTKTRYANTNVELVRLGVDIPANVKTEVAIKARRLGITMTEIVIRFLAAWVAGKVELPMEK